MKCLRFIIAILTLLLAQSISFAQNPYATNPSEVPRFALVIFVEQYDFLPRVVNAQRDGLEVASALSKAGFEFVRVVPNPSSTSEILEGLSELEQRARMSERAATVAVYYAGHGFQNGNTNYLLPKSANPASLATDGIAIPLMMSKLRSNKFGLSIVLLDACRTINTLDSSNFESRLANAALAGFGQMSSQNFSVVSLATGFGRAAQSVGSRNINNSPYAGALTQNLNLGARSLDEILEEVRTSVLIDTNGLQSPEIIKNAGTSKYFFHPSSAQKTMEDQSWNDVLATGPLRECVEMYISRYPASRYSNAARYLLSSSAQGSETRGVCP